MTRIEPEKLSASQRVERAAPSDADKLLALYRSNRAYFDYFSLDATKERLIDDMTILPDGCRAEQKHFLVFGGDQPEAILDLIEDYPTKGTCYIGLFMVDRALTNQGVGTEIISGLCDALKQAGFEAVRLAYGKRYRAARFWTKNGFSPLREATHKEYGELIVAQRRL